MTIDELWDHFRKLLDIERDYRTEEIRRLERLIKDQDNRIKELEDRA
jgi:hypothetical protein